MKKVFLVCLCFFVLCGCSAVQTPMNGVVPSPILEEFSRLTPPPAPSVDALLVAALKLLGEGQYEEAILAYTAIIEIEPKNFDAQFGLGQAYRKNKQSDKAVAPLREACSLQTGSKPAAIELGYAFLDIGEYTEAEKLAMELLGERMPDLRPTSTPNSEKTDTLPTTIPLLSNEEGEALTLLLLSLGGEEKTEELQALLRVEAFRGYLNEMVITHDGVLYVGAYNVEGQREGKGVGIYPQGYMYVGEYQDNVRSGQGKWYYLSGNAYYIGAWANDAPNGEGEIRSSSGGWQEGTFVDGKAEGIYVSHTESIASYQYLCKDGVPQPIRTGGREDYLAAGETIMAYMMQYDEPWTPSPHYWAGLRCTSCGTDTGGGMPEWFRPADNHAWSGWREVRIFGVSGFIEEGR